MRLVLDTNVLLSALISPTGAPARLLDAWRRQRFVLVTSIDQLEELRTVSRRPKMQAYIRRTEMGLFVNQLKLDSLLLERLPVVDRSIDPADNFLLAMVEAGEAEFLVSGDRRGVLDLQTHGTARIVRAREMLTLLGIKDQAAGDRGSKY